MTIQRTRELLKEKVQHLTDKQILELIQRTDKSIDALLFLAINKAIAKCRERALQ